MNRKGVRVRAIGLISATTAFLVYLAPSAEAQVPHEHSGFWWGVGLGWGVNVTDGLDDGRNLDGPVGTLRAGGTVSQKVLLAADVVFWNTDDFDANLFRGNTTFAVYYYPMAQKGAYVKGGVGLGRVGADLRVIGGTTTDSKVAFGTTVGAGFDLRVGANLYLTPTVDWLFQWFEEINGTSFNSLIAATLSINAH